MTGREIFNRYRKILFFVAWLFKSLPMFFKIFIWDLIKPFSQSFFIACRYIILKSSVKVCGDNIKVGCNVRIVGWNNLSLGSNISIHDNCYIDATGSIEINNNVSIAHNTSILSFDHQYKDSQVPIKYNSLIFEKVIIKEDVWIGCGCRILSGALINSRSIIAAGAVVNKTVDSNSIYAGVPAKFIKNI